MNFSRWTFHGPPLIPAAVCFALGVAAARNVQGLEAMLAGILVLVLTAAGFFLRTRTLSLVLLFLSVFLLGALRMVSSRQVAWDDISRAAGSVKKQVSLEGTVACEPRVSARQTSFILEVDHYRSGEKRAEARGKVWVRCFAPGSFGAGERYLIEGDLVKPAGPMVRFLSFSGARAILNVSKSGRLERLPEQGFMPSQALRKKVACVYFRYLDAGTAGLYEAMVLGTKQKVPKEIREMMVRTGTWHIMVVSGSHTAFLAGIFLVLLKILRLPRRPRFYAVIAGLIAYCFLTGASSPVVRATVMTSVILASYLAERNPVFYHSLALAGLMILAFDPGQLFDAGFQLSFLSVFFIAWLFPRLYPYRFLKKRLKVPIFFKGTAAGLASALVVSFSAWIGTAPLILCVFGYFSPVSIAANLAVVPIAGIVTAAGFVLLVFGPVCPACAPTLAAAAQFFMWLFLKINASFKDWPFGVFDQAHVSGYWLLAVYPLILVIFSRGSRQDVP